MLLLRRKLDAACCVKVFCDYLRRINSVRLGIIRVGLGLGLCIIKLQSPIWFEAI